MTIGLAHESEFEPTYFANVQRYWLPADLAIEEEEVASGAPVPVGNLFRLEGMRTVTIFYEVTTAVATRTTVLYLRSFQQDDATAVKSQEFIATAGNAGVGATFNTVVDLGIGAATLRGRVWRTHQLEWVASGSGELPHASIHIFARS